MKVPWFVPVVKPLYPLVVPQPNPCPNHLETVYFNTTPLTFHPLPRHPQQE